MFFSLIGWKEQAFFLALVCISAGTAQIVFPTTKPPQQVTPGGVVNQGGGSHVIHGGGPAVAQVGGNPSVAHGSRAPPVAQGGGSLPVAQGGGASHVKPPVTVGGHEGGQVITFQQDEIRRKVSTHLFSYGLKNFRIYLKNCFLLVKMQFSQLRFRCT